MQSRIVIHCGVQKTGSTAFHHFVQKNRDALSPCVDLHTPVKGSLMRDLGRTAARFSLDDAPEAEFTALIDRMRATLAKTDKTALLSHENLPGAMLGRGGVVTLYPRLERIIDLLDRHLAPFEPHYVFCTREMSRWKASVYNQAVRSDGYDRPWDAFLSETADCGTWDSLQDRLVAAVGPERVTVLRIEDEADRDRPGLRLLRLCGVPETVLTTLQPVAGRRNESLNSGALEFMRRLNALKLPRAERRKVAKLIQESETLFQSERVPA